MDKPIDVGYGIYDDVRFDGGKGSGNFNHAGVKGRRGGSANRNGSQLSNDPVARRLTGLKTSDGKTIKGVLQHAIDRMKEKNIYESSVKSAIVKGKKSPSRTKAGRSTYDYNGTRVVVQDNNSNIVTITYKGK